MSATQAAATSAFTPASFRETLGHYPTGVVVVTGIAEDGTPAGMVVGSFTSVSLDPPLVAFLPTKESGSWARLSTASSFAINVLAADQEDLCRRFASRVPDKFEGVEWRPAPHGAPILDGVVAWIECDYHQIVEGGDHWIVMGRVTDLAIDRPALPLLFFQGGYGRFSPPSLVAPTDPELLTAVRVAELARDAIETLAWEHQVDCSVMTRVGDEVVFVLTSNQSVSPTVVSVGHRVPFVAPAGAAFLVDASEEEVERWIGAARIDEETADLIRAHQEKVRERGYSLSLHSPTEDAGDGLHDRLTLLEDYSSADALPAHGRAFRSLIAETAPLYEPDIVDGVSYSLHSIVVPVPLPAGQPPIALRMAGLRPHTDGAVVRRWIADLQETARAAAARLAGSHESPYQKEELR